MADQLTVVTDGTFVNPGLVRVGDLPNLNADVSALEVKTQTLLDYYNTKLGQKTSWHWADVAGVPYAQTPNPGVRWGFAPIPGLLQYGEVTGTPQPGDHLIAATPAAILAVRNYFIGALSASRKVNGYDLRKDVFVTAEDLGSYSTDKILELAAQFRFPTDLPGEDYRLIQATVTYNPSTNDAPNGAIHRIVSASETAVTLEYFVWTILKDGVWSVTP